MDAPDKSHESGFSLILLIVLVAVVALGVSVIPNDAFFSTTYRGDTEEELEMLADAIHDYFADTRAFPSSLSALTIKPSGVSNWLGTYSGPETDVDHEAANNYTRDAWGSLYSLAVTGTGRATLTSRGSDRTLGTSDDVQIIIDCSDVLREESLAEIDVVEAAILAWNEDCLPATPLPTNYSALLDTLQLWHYLPPGAAIKAKYLTDGWGLQYVTGPPPVFDIDSASGL